MRRIARILAGLIAGLTLMTAVSIVLTPADPELFPGEGPVVHVVDHGYHSGIMIRPADLRRAALELDLIDGALGDRLRWLTSRFPQAPWLEIGWGDAAFYQVTPTIGDIDVGLALRAILWPTESALQIVPIYLSPEDFLALDQGVSLRLSEAGLGALARELAETVPEDLPDAIGPSLYGGGAFYPATLSYHLFRTCNHWVARLVRAAGAPTSPVLATFSSTLIMDLRWRADLG
ncbi:MAG: DUF2459 domain-containing protein [Pseudomonadota bacterium]